MPFVAGIFLVTFVALALFGTVLAGAAEAHSPDNRDIGIAVTVAPSDTATPTPITTAGATSQPISAVTAAPTPAPSAGATGAVGSRVAGDVALGVPVFASGLGSHYLWSANPTASAATLTITVKNESSSTFSSAVRFWVDTPVGSQVGNSVVMEVRGLKPGSSRLVQTTIVGLGQWTVLTAHAVVTPPSVIDGRKVIPLRRDAYIVIPPVAAGGISVALAVGFVAFKFVSFARAAALLKLVT